LQKLVGEFPQQLKGVRGKGYLIGLQFTGETAPVQAALREAGLLAPTAGGNVIRLLPPLIATASELNRSVEILRGVLKTRA
jgi:acetylornithine aminotransferase/acetylornithine/N-succinyldiaminopimelate aminotransferase